MAQQHLQRGHSYIQATKKRTQYVSYIHPKPLLCQLAGLNPGAFQRVKACAAVTATASSGDRRKKIQTIIERVPNRLHFTQIAVRRPMPAVTREMSLFPSSI